MSNFTIGSELAMGTTSESDEADAIACLIRYGAMDLAPMLGLA